MEYSSRLFVPNISAKYFRRNAIKKKEKVVNLLHLLPSFVAHNELLQQILRLFPPKFCEGGGD